MNTAIETALAARGIIPSNFTCGICKDELHRDDCAKPNTFSTVYDYLQHKFGGGHICHECADEYRECDCSNVFHADELDDNGLCESCAEEAEFVRLGQLDIEREMRGMI